MASFIHVVCVCVCVSSSIKPVVKCVDEIPDFPSGLVADLGLAN